MRSRMRRISGFGSRQSIGATSSDRCRPITRLPMEAEPRRRLRRDGRIIDIRPVAGIAVEPVMHEMGEAQHVEGRAEQDRP